MQYDFDQVVDRSKNLSAKYDERVKKFGTDDVIPLWIADMDFRTAQPVIDALKARAEEGIWACWCWWEQLRAVTALLRKLWDCKAKAAHHYGAPQILCLMIKNPFQQVIGL